MIGVTDHIELHIGNGDLNRSGIITNGHDDCIRRDDADLPILFKLNVVLADLSGSGLGI